MSSTNPNSARFVGQVLRGIGVLAIAAGLIVYLYCMSQGRLYLAAVVLGVCVTSMPLIPEGKGDRLVAVLTSFCGFLGFLAGVVIYFAMFNFSWFWVIFNGKGGGPLGLILFAVSFTLVGVYAGERGLRCFRRRPEPPRPESE
jgi:hypothetical protein